MKKFKLLYVVIGLLYCCSVSASLTNILDDMLAGTNSIKIVLGDNKINQQKLDALQAEYNDLKADDEKFFDELDRTKQDIKEDILDTKLALEKAPSDFESQRFTLLNKYDQLLLDLGDVRRKYVDTAKKHIDYIEAYMKNADTYIKNEKSEYEIGKKSVHSFDDLHNLTKAIARQDEILSDLQSKKDDANGVVERLNASSLLQEKKIQEIDEKISDARSQEGDIKEYIALLDLEKSCTDLEKKLFSLQIDMNRRIAQFVDSQIFVIQNKLYVLKENLHSVRLYLRIDQSDVAVYEQQYNRAKRESQELKAEFIQQRNSLIAEKKEIQDSLDALNRELKISKSNVQQLGMWDIQEETISEIDDACQAAQLETAIITINRKLDITQVSILLEDAKIAKAKIEFDVISSLYLINQMQFKDTDHINAEHEIYRGRQQSLISQLKYDKEQIANAHGYIKSQHKALSNIKKVEEKIYVLSRRSHREDYKRSVSDALHALTLAQASYAEQNSLSVKLSELYTQVMTMHEESLGTVIFTVKEFDLIGVWHRSNRAITWKSIKQGVPNFFLFTYNIKTILAIYFSSLSFKNIALYIKLSEPSSIFTFFFILLLLFVFFAILQSLVAYVSMVFERKVLEKKASSYVTSLSWVLLSFVHGNFFLLYACAGLWFLSIKYTFSAALLILLYISSLVVLIYLSRLFLRHFMEKNARIDHALLSKRLELRFSFILLFFSFSTVIILFLRKLFMLVMMYQKSEFPTILLRLYHVVVFISIVSSIDKEELLHLFPQTGFFAQKCRDFINRFYTLILFLGLCLLIMSDPYLGGYGSLVWHIIFHGFLTIITVAVLFFIHQLIKRYSTLLFFKEDDDYGSSAERFDYAKTWYAVYVIALFGLYFLATAIACSKIWGYGITYQHLMDVLHYGVFTIGVVDKSGKVVQSYLRISGLLRILVISLSGFVLAYLFQRFILKRVFEIQYVDPGVQNTVTTIARYFIIFSMILIAFARADLGFVIMYVLGIGLLTFGFSFKDLLTDVVAYFFILVQRPIKLGDYIMLDDETMGVVRKISPRAVLLRRKNSVTIVVPNSRILKSCVYNWNYTRSFFAFDDIVFSVPFTANIVEVRKILLQVLAQHPEVLKVPESIVRLEDFGDKGYVFLVRGFLSFSNTLNQWDIMSDVRFKIVAALKEQGITVAEPVLRVDMNKQISNNH
jgi:small-conductance mechanosensitive channel